MDRCPHGHAYTEENTAFRTDRLTGRKSRSCKTCKRENDARFRAKTRSGRGPSGNYACGHPRTGTGHGCSTCKNARARALRREEAENTGCKKGHPASDRYRLNSGRLMCRVCTRQSKALSEKRRRLRGSKLTAEGRCRNGHDLVALGGRNDRGACPQCLEQAGVRRRAAQDRKGRERRAAMSPEKRRWAEALSEAVTRKRAPVTDGLEDIYGPIPEALEYHDHYDWVAVYRARRRIPVGRDLTRPEQAIVNLAGMYQEGEAG
jgi:hypothetical protein